MLRGNPVADRLFYAATELGDFGLIWVLIGGTQGLGCESRLGRARLTATFAVESVVVNGVIKSFFSASAGVPGAPALQDAHAVHHELPERAHQHRGRRRHPAVGGPAQAAPFYWAVAGVVASSRVYVRIHHASDVVGGVATGLVIGTAARAFWKRVGSG